MSFPFEKLEAYDLAILRQVVENSYGDDTRLTCLAGHPCSALGHCYVASKWLASYLGSGHVGMKHGHYFWVSDQGTHFIDLTRDAAHYGSSTAPPLFSLMSSAYRGYEMVDFPSSRYDIFAERADYFMRRADLLGPSGLITPQQEHSWNMWAPMPFFHDVPDDEDNTPVNTEYNFLIANGEVHLSPHHELNQLADHAQVAMDQSAPLAMGTATVSGNHVVWRVNTNMSLKYVHDLLEGFTNQAGWKWDGMVGINGEHLDDDFGPKLAMWYNVRSDGHLLLSHSPLKSGKPIFIKGSNAYLLLNESAKVREALSEWANDSHYRIAEWPGGGNALDQMKNMPYLDIDNKGDPDAKIQRDNPDATPSGELICGQCGKKFDSFENLRLHYTDHEPKEQVLDPVTFPYIDDMDAPLPFRRLQPVPNGGEIIACITLPSYKAGLHLSAFANYAKFAGYSDENMRFYGAYRNGALVGVASVKLGKIPEITSINTPFPHLGVETALVNLIQRQYDEGLLHMATIRDYWSLQPLGIASVGDGLWKWSKSKEPKDLIKAPIPFVYDLGEDFSQPGKVYIGYAGQQTHHVMPPPDQSFSANILRGFYEPGGLVTFIDNPGMLPFTTYRFGQDWYSHYPQMRITKVEIHNYKNKKNHKVSASNVGQYIQQLIQADPAAQIVYRALKSNGAQVYAVGEGVRDVLMQREPENLELSTANMNPDEILSILENLPGDIEDQGDGIYRYSLGNFHVDVNLHSLIHPKHLDFSVNSMAVDLDSGALIDPHEGAEDAQRGVLRGIHNDIFQEDPTRLLKMLKLHGDAMIPSHDLAVNAHDNADLLKLLSSDDLRKGLDDIIGSARPGDAIRLSKKLGLLKHLIPELDQHWTFQQRNKHHKFLLGEHLAHVLDNLARLSDDKDLRISGLLHDIGKPESQWLDDEGNAHFYRTIDKGADHEAVGAKIAKERLHMLGYPPARIKRIQELISNHMFPAFTTIRGAKKFLTRYGEYADDLLTLRHADMNGRGQQEDYLEQNVPVEHMRALLNQARRNHDTGVQNIAVNGDDLLSLGYKPGPMLGRVLRELVDYCIANPQYNNRSTLLQLAKEKLQSR